MEEKSTEIEGSRKVVRSGWRDVVSLGTSLLVEIVVELLDVVLVR
jgi:hypothetical protein